jgi:type II secretion system protein I
VRCTRGFTLIEVLVAMAIVAIGMAAVLGTLTSSAEGVSYLRDKTLANWVALNQIALARLKGQAPPPGKSDGDTDYAGRKWHWHQEVATTQLPGMVRMDVSVRPADADIPASADRGWYVTLSGIWGDAVGLPRGDLPDWGSQLLMPGTVGNPPGTTGTNPAAPAGGAQGTPPSRPTPTPNPPPTSGPGTQ